MSFKSSFFLRADPDRLFQQVFRRSLVKKFTIQSRILGIPRSFYVYFPKGYENLNRRFPVLYLFRNHESEWMNQTQDSSRQGRNLQVILDGLINKNQLQPMLVVMPGLSSQSGQFPGLGVNFRSPGLAGSSTEVGTGQFETYITRELIPLIDRRFRTIPKRDARATDGFSLGGYTSIILALRNPGLFCSAGSFDGTHMWQNFRDPRKADHRDQTWLDSPQFTPAFGKPFSIPMALEYNASNLIVRHIRTGTRPDLQFLISFVDREPDGNRDRNLHLLELLGKAGYSNGLSGGILHPEATHCWYWADEHLKTTLPLHGKRLFSSI